VVKASHIASGIERDKNKGKQFAVKELVSDFR
jgi:hypothetical protein